MKKLGWLWALGIGGVIVLAIVMAGELGQKNPAMVRGKVVLSDTLKPAAEGARVLFLIVSPTDTPMPYGAFRKTVGDKPEGVIFEFALTYDNLQRMREDLPWPAQFKLKARLDRDGVAGPDQPGDLVGEVAPLAPGATDVEVKIDRLVN